MVVICGVSSKAHYLAMDLPQSDDCFVMAFPAETTEAFLEGHNHAFVYFGGVPRTILYHNTKLALARISKRLTRVATVSHVVRANQEWALDFVCDSLGTGRGIRVLAVLDAFTRENLCLEVDTSLSAAG